MTRWQIVFLAAVVAILTGSLIGVTLATAGTPSDPVVTLSYVDQTLKPDVLSKIEAKIEQKIKSPSIITARGERAVSSISEDEVVDAAANIVLQRLQAKGKYLYSTKGMEFFTLRRGDVISGLPGTTIILKDGSGIVVNQPIINITSGTELPKSSPVVHNVRYMIPANNWSGVKITSSSATVGIDGSYRLSSLRYHPQYYDLADALKRMNLFRGTASGYELERNATRAESIVMLLRLLGEEQKAKDGTPSHPFDDIDTWADKYIGFAYSKGYARGVANTHFGAKNATTANHYMTFLLRALGYNDKQGDFTWDHAMDKAVALKIITQNERDMIIRSGFQRDHMVYLSYYTLFAKMKGKDTTLLNNLINSGIVKKADADAAIKAITRKRL